MAEKDGTREPGRSTRKKSSQGDATPGARAKRSARSGARAAAPEFDRPHDVDRTTRVAVAAYYLAERRGFAPGCELEDWLAAEAQLEATPPPAARPGSSKPRKSPASRHTSAS